jgi:hypothetical protein
MKAAEKKPILALRIQVERMEPRGGGISMSRALGIAAFLEGMAQLDPVADAGVLFPG